MNSFNQKPNKLTIVKKDEDLFLHVYTSVVDYDLLSFIEDIYHSNINVIYGTVRKNIDSCFSYFYPLTEDNIVKITEKINLNYYEVDEEILSYYNTIKSWDEDLIKKPYIFDQNENNQFFKLINEEINEPLTKNIIYDRRLRYQYLIDDIDYDKSNLTEKIAHRSFTKLWVDKNIFSIKDVIDSLRELKRFPILFLFDQHNHEQSLQYLKNIVCEENKNIGVYFRLPNTNNLQEFNKFVVDNNYNNLLSENTQIAVIQNGKIPKFFFKVNWTPKSIVQLDFTRQNKTMSYANDMCDLHILYADNNAISWEKYGS